MPNSRDQLLACIPRLRRYARALVGDRAGADDLVQDTVERGWGRLASWEGGSDMRAWLFSIMHNLRIDQARRPSVPTEALNEETSMARLWCKLWMRDARTIHVLVAFMLLGQLPRFWAEFAP